MRELSPSAVCTFAVRPTVEETVGHEAAGGIGVAVLVRVERVALHIALGRDGAELSVPARLDVRAVVLGEGREGRE